MYTEFLPLCKADMLERGWQYVDFAVVTGDAYIDHPSFGAAIISRVLESMGFKVGIISQPDFSTHESMCVYGMPRYGFFVGGGNVDSMVAHYSVAKKRRSQDEYTPGKKTGKRPDRCVTVYTKMAKKAYPKVPVIIGGLEASLRRFAHYDYWQDEVHESVLSQSGADLLVYGMAENQTRTIAARLAKGESAGTITDVSGTCYLTSFENLPQTYANCASFEKVKSDKVAYAKACRIQLDNQDSLKGLHIVQKQKQNYLVQNPPCKPLERNELDEVYALPFTRSIHPSYKSKGGVCAIEEVEFSIIHNRGCFGGCNFCAIQLHQGRHVTSRSIDSVVKEAQIITQCENFKGYIHDIGGPTANFRDVSCKKQLTKGMCTKNKKCLAPSPCPNLIVDHKEYVQLLKKVRELPKIKKVFIRSGIRYDYVMRDNDETFFNELVKHYVSGQLKVAPEHCAPITLKHMGKPNIETYNKFSKAFYQKTKQIGKKQYLVPYLMSSHPGSTLKDAIYLAEYLHKNSIRPEQVQDFYPTPGTVSTCMYYTGLDPFTLEKVFVAKTDNEKAMQRALLQYFNPKNQHIVKKALEVAGRQDLMPKFLPGIRQSATVNAKHSSNKFKRVNKNSNAKKRFKK